MKIHATRIPLNIFPTDISNLRKINNASMHNIFIVPMVPEEEETWRCISFPHNFPNSYYQDGYIWMFCIQITYLFGSLGIHFIRIIRKIIESPDQNKNFMNYYFYLRCCGYEILISSWNKDTFDKEKFSTLFRLLYAYIILLGAYRIQTVGFYPLR